MDVYWGVRSVWMAQVEVQKAQVEIPRAVLEPELRYPDPPEPSGTRAHQVTSGPKYRLAVHTWISTP